MKCLAFKVITMNTGIDRKKFLSTIALISLLITSAYAQFERTAGKVVTDRQPGGIIETWNLEKAKEVEGSFFMNENWYVGSINLYDGRVLENIPLKYNLRDDFLHILDENGENRIMRTNKIKSFRWFNLENKENEEFSNSSDYDIHDTPLTGVVKVLVEGKCDLLLHKNLILQKGTYSVVHDAGQKYDEYIINEDFYVDKDDHLQIVKNKKTVLNIFEEEREKLKSYIKENRINVKKEEGLIAVVNYYNSL